MALVKFWHSAIGGPMDTEKPTWQELCQAAATEDDPQKLMKLIAQINRERRTSEAAISAFAPSAKLGEPA
jgi:hypothetical protein